MTSDSSKTQRNGLWIIDASGATVHADEGMAGILGTTAADLIGKDSFLYVFAEDMPAAKQLFAKKQAGSSAPFRFRLRRADGGAIWVDVQGTPLHNPAGKFLGIVGTFTVSKSQI